MKEKLMANKNLIIGLVAVVIVAVVILCVSMFAKPSYKKQIKNWAKACESEEKMEKYVKKTANLRACMQLLNLCLIQIIGQKKQTKYKKHLKKNIKMLRKRLYR